MWSKCQQPLGCHGPLLLVAIIPMDGMVYMFFVFCFYTRKILMEVRVFLSVGDNDYTKSCQMQSLPWVWYILCVTPTPTP